ncbi:MAG: hypothetical protein QOC63_5782 [Mycobacterium sp.]|jgi:hypothetical protein|nr:hypothetical protein [Mycobacterium sp.]
MQARSVDRRRLAVAGGAVLIAMGAMTTACGTSGNQTPSTTSTTTTTPAPASSAPTPPTEKSINPTGGNLFTPPVVAPPAATVTPGQHPGINGVN